MKNPYTFTGDARFKEALLEKLKAAYSPELSDEALLQVVGGQSAEPDRPPGAGCPDWENADGEPYRGCHNCTHPFCRDL